MAELWDSFARSVLPANTSTVQRWEMRRAFYAGARGIMFKVIAGLASDEEPTNDDLVLMHDLQVELDDFALAVKEGRA